MKKRRGPSQPWGTRHNMVSSWLVAPPGLLLLGALVFGVSHSVFALYSINQHAHFLRGLADAGLGYLNEDWYANTTDPFPVFTLAVDVTYRFLHEFLFYCYYLVFAGVYFYSIVGIASTIFKIDSSRLKYVAFIAIIILIHTRPFGFIFDQLLGVNLATLLYTGVASLKILSYYFQPSLFGVFILLSIHLFLIKKPFVAVLFLGLANLGSPSYILSMLALTLSYMYVVFKESRSFRKPILMGLFSAALIVPILTYVYLAFRQTSPDLWSESLSILINLRAPIHHDPSLWLGPMAYVKTGVVMVALYLVRKTPLSPVLLVPLAFAVILTVAQIVSGSNFLAAATPWRISVFLVPIATGVIVAFAVSRAFEIFGRRLYAHQGVLLALSFVAISQLVVVGIVLTRISFQDHREDHSVPMMTFVRETKNQGDQFLVPTELRRFRIYTGAPIFVDFWSFPFKDTEVLEWRDRYLFAQRFYDPGNDTICGDVTQVSEEYGITHMVISSGRFDTSCSNLARIYGDDSYRVFRIEP